MAVKQDIRVKIPLRPQCVTPLEDGRHLLLLRVRAVVLDGEDDGERRRHERRLRDRLHDVPERDLGREGVPVVDDGLQQGREGGRESSNSRAWLPSLKL